MCGWEAGDGSPVASNPISAYFLPVASFTSIIQLILAWISKYIAVWDEVIYPFKNFNRETVFSPHTLLGMWLLIHAGIKYNLC